MSRRVYDGDADRFWGTARVPARSVITSKPRPEMAQSGGNTMADPITAKSPPQKERILPPPGLYSAVCVDVIDLGWHVNEKYGKTEHKCAIVWQIDETHPETGERFEVSQRYTVSMAPKARLRKDLNTWRGKPYTDVEAEEGAPLDKLVGVNATIQVVHSQNGDKTYANVDVVAQPTKGAPRLIPQNYERAPWWADVKAKSVPAPVPVDPDSYPDAIADDDDDLPF